MKNFILVFTLLFLINISYANGLTWFHDYLGSSKNQVLNIINANSSTIGTKLYQAKDNEIIFTWSSIVPQSEIRFKVTCLFVNDVLVSINEEYRYSGDLVNLLDGYAKMYRDEFYEQQHEKVIYKYCLTQKERIFTYNWSSFADMLSNEGGSTPRNQEGKSPNDYTGEGVRLGKFITYTKPFLNEFFVQKELRYHYGSNYFDSTQCGVWEPRYLSQTITLLESLPEELPTYFYKN